MFTCSAPIGSASDDRRQPVLVCEGESDTICASGFGLQSIGAPGASTWRATWADLLTEFEVVVVGDGDEAGRRFEQAVRKTIPAAALVRLDDGDDLRALLQRGGLGRFEQRLAEARFVVRTEAAIFGSREIEEVERRLDGTEQMTMSWIRDTLDAASRGREFDVTNTIVRFSTLELPCATCGEVMPHHLDRGWFCQGCEVACAPGVIA